MKWQTVGLPEGLLAPQVDWARVDAATEEEIAAQIAEDDAEAIRDAAAYARRVRRKVGLSQIAFARRIGVPVDTVGNWKGGKPAPQGPDRALLRIMDGFTSYRHGARQRCRSTSDGGCLSAPCTRPATAAVAALLLQACQTAPPAQSSLDGYAFPSPEGEIPAVVREDAHPADMFSYDLPASHFQRLETESVDGTGQQYWTDPRIARWQRDTVYQQGAFRVERISSDQGIGGYHAYYGPFRTNMYEWHENGAWRAFRLTDLSKAENTDCAAGIPRIDGFDPRQLCWSLHWEGDRAVGATRDRSDQQTSMRVTGTTAVTVNVNGRDYRLPAYAVDRSYSAWTEGSEVELAYVPVLGDFVEWEGKRVGPGPVSRSRGRVVSAQVSDEVLKQVEAAAVR